MALALVQRHVCPSSPVGAVGWSGEGVKASGSGGKTGVNELVSQMCTVFIATFW